MNHRKIAALFFNLVLAFGIAITTLPAQAAVPQTLNYQGQLANAAGAPVNAAVNITFKLYDAATLGNLLWSETQSVTVSNGLYSVTLGQTTPLTPALFGAPLYLGITVGNDTEMTPRTALGSSATALHAGLADSINCTGCVSATHIAAGTITSAQLAVGSVTAPLLAAGAVTTSAISAGAITAAQLAPGAVATSWTDGTGKVTTTANVGVGTTTPAAALHVVGSMIIPGNNVQTSANTTNTLLGVMAGNATMTGTGNTANGYSALLANTTGSDNTASGGLALYSNTTGFNNTASGKLALMYNTTGNFNTANGYRALYFNTTGTSNTASGAQALMYNTTGTSNTASGDSALYSNTTGVNNTASGSLALANNTTGTSNTASGANALQFNTTGVNNTASGDHALFSNTTGNQNTALGSAALLANTTGNQNTALGSAALLANTTGNQNTASGYSALAANTTGTYNVATGMNALLNNAGGGQNVAVGVSALNANVSGTNNTAVGNIALLSNTGSSNIALGFNAGGNLTTGASNIDIGNAGVAAEAATIRIGDVNQTRAFIAGIRGVTTGTADGLPVVIDSSGQLGTVASLSTIIPAGSITGTQLAAGTVTSSLLATGSVSAAQIADGAITAAKLAPGAVATSWTDGTGQVTTTANVGVGTAAPVVNARLDVQGGAINIGGIGNADAALHIKSSFGGFDRLTQIHPTAASKPGLNLMASTNSAAAAQWWAWGPDTGNVWRIQPGAAFTGSTGLFIDNTGKVGIGTTAPAATLHVVGSMNIPGNNVQTAADATSTFLGVNAGNTTMTGRYNTANGYAALQSNTSGGSNTAIGGGVLQANTTGCCNTAIGWHTLYVNTTGNNNTASGIYALKNTTGIYNIGIGSDAGALLTTGDYNIDIGNWGVAAESNTIRIGDAFQTRAFIAGIRGVTTGVANGIPVVIDSNGQLGTVSSSRRFKDDIADMSEASSLLMKLRPVTFTYKADKGPTRALQYGLIAEEVAAIAPGLVAHSADGQIETVYYQFLAPMLLNEYQKQQRTIETQAAALEAQKMALARQTARIAELESAKASQEARLTKMESQVQLLLTQALADKRVASR